jgi:probable phosphoglycerate mutase
VPLNETGLAQAEATAQRIAAEWRPTAVHASPLSRAARTAEAIARCVGLTARPHAGLIDIHYGQWQGLSPDEVRERWPEVLQAWYDAPHTASIPGGETLEEVRSRGMAAVNELAARHEGETVVLVGHTVVNRAILLGVLGLGNDRFWRLRQDTCAINVFDVECEDFTLVSLNDTCHLRTEVL